ncbi:MAG: rhodanese-like domain-containing protein [Candidatus Thiodiazotropha sp. (ex Lucina aurantia)]|uniref:Rhodanese-like domain protein n=2 Tax=Candidatus Thiodiazotropha TaxID=1913444 RepID=A0A7Z0VQU3_9GAMM|nr:rhodanese-like domain-containing protein [Candidatus Thiodiazotropha sp. (ex Lucina pensylvanica)]MBT3017936.1 rhodanese-like domain-containing protein [Candidatus Thiodiazotropha taylori]MBT3038853.1 rhodanese-like domain-containing protein [Candidatus Thiodiazotropha sp. (ex Codakia orbicularis)]MBV2102817.1 rhodanese-like domain-containing protein [Candidatus Thiodiazotropha sp. (ex Lucina aurantia)]MCW4236353.1 rhodanese-like domain-containing protein [Candidatus Thiodiazotropha endoluci
MGKQKISVLISSLFAVSLTAISSAAALEVMITPEIGEFSVKHAGKELMIRRNQDTDALLEFDFARTSRPCPPFCAQPIQVTDGVNTIGEVELIAFMKTALNEGSGLLIDARTPDWHERGTIPGSINVPFTHLNPDQGADEITLEESLILFGATMKGKNRDFTEAKTLVLWCNGPWCGQSPTAIRGLLSIGYPAEKLYYYRGGMQLWQVFGLPVVTPEGELVDQ